MTKVCPKCRQEKPATTEYFNRCKHTRDGLQSWCRECKKKDHLEHKEARNLRARERYRAMHPKEEIPEGFKKCSNCKQLKPATNEYFSLNKRTKDGFAHRCKECRKNAEYWFCPDKIKEKRRQYYQQNKAKVLEATRRYRQANQDWYKKYYKIYYRKNSEKIKQKVKSYVLSRVKRDINFRLLTRYRTRLYKALKGLEKPVRAAELIGCSIDELKQHLEGQFKEGMSWDNYGKWHVDHIVPCSLFDLTKEDELRKCFHYTNLQPLWAEENIKKSNRLIS